MVNSVSENTLKTWLSLLRMIDLCCAWLPPFIPLLKHPFRFDPATFLNELIIQSKSCKDEEPYLSPSRRSHQLTHLISVDDWIGYCNKQSQELLLNTLKHSNTFWAPESRGKQLHIIPWKPRSSFLYISNCFGLFPIRISVHCQITMSRSFFNQTGLVPMILIEHSVPRPSLSLFLSWLSKIRALINGSRTSDGDAQGDEMLRFECAGMKVEENPSLDLLQKRSRVWGCTDPKMLRYGDQQCEFQGYGLQ